MPAARATADAAAEDLGHFGVHELLQQPTHLEEIVGLDPTSIRALFESHSFMVQEWDKARTDSLTIRKMAMVPPAVT